MRVLLLMDVDELSDEAKAVVWVIFSILRISRQQKHLLISRNWRVGECLK